MSAVGLSFSHLRQRSKEPLLRDGFDHICQATDAIIYCQFYNDLIWISANMFSIATRFEIMSEKYVESVAFIPYVGFHNESKDMRVDNCPLYVIEPVSVEWGIRDAGRAGCDQWLFPKMAMFSNDLAFHVRGAESVHEAAITGSADSTIKHLITFGNYLWYERQPEVFPLKDRTSELTYFFRLPCGNKAVQYNFKPKWAADSISSVEDILVGLGYAKAGSERRIILISRVRDGGVSEVVWSCVLDLDGSLKLTKIRAYEKPLFESTMFAESKSTDYRVQARQFKKVAITRSAEKFIRESFRYDRNTGKVLTGKVNLSNVVASKITETKFVRGHVKFTIAHHEGAEDYFTMKVQSAAVKQLAKVGTKPASLEELKSFFTQLKEAADEFRHESRLGPQGLSATPRVPAALSRASEADSRMLQNPLYSTGGSRSDETRRKSL